MGKTRSYEDWYIDGLRNPLIAAEGVRSCIVDLNDGMMNEDETRDVLCTYLIAIAKAHGISLIESKGDVNANQ